MKRALLLTMFGALIAAGVTHTPVAHADPVDDVAFLLTLDQRGIRYGSATDGIAAGHKVCNLFAAGDGLYQVVQIVYLNSGLDRGDAAYFVGASTAAYCSQYNIQNPRSAA